jgi:hypothetical protein
VALEPAQEPLDLRGRVVRHLDVDTQLAGTAIEYELDDALFECPAEL